MVLQRIYGVRIYILTVIYILPSDRKKAYLPIVCANMDMLEPIGTSFEVSAACTTIMVVTLNKADPMASII